MKNLNINYSQKGLAYFPEFGTYCTYYLKEYDRESHKIWQLLAEEIDGFSRKKEFRITVILGIGFELWDAWCKELGYTRPKAMGNKNKLTEYAQAFGNSGGDFWFHIKSSHKEDIQPVLDLIAKAFEDICRHEKTLIITAQKKHEGKVLGGRFTDGLINPGDAEDLSERTVIGLEDKAHRGGSFMISQRFEHNWTKLNSMSEIEKEDMIGRDRDDRIIPMHDESSHIKRVRQLNDEKINFRLLRQALPFGNKEDNKAHEKGIFFAGYTKSTEALDKILDGIAGSQTGFIQDKLFSVTHSTVGSYWYIPSLAECGIKESVGNEEITMNEYFNIRSDNGFMFYNAKDYQHKVRTSKLTDDCPISDRILLLIDKQFSRWHDTWYKKRETPPLGHISGYLDKNDPLLNASVVLRKGMASKLSLSKVLISKEYSEKANLMIIDPDEIIVGNMPQLSLGIGSQVMEYLTEEEKITGFFGNLNEYSATGHNAPDYHLIVTEGIDAIREKFQDKYNTSTDESKEFYQAVVWTLEGLSTFIEAYAIKAREMLKDTEDYSQTEIHNLELIAHRMERIAHKTPRTFIEGLNLVFLVNCALHQTGEPMSIGRMDQFMYNLYKNDKENDGVSEDKFQEALDSFWLKMDETVLYNYNHLNDYLNYGTGAVFYSAGNFPQGAAINQWVQQLTVGGVVANDSQKPIDASNELTKMCLRSSRRLPLNAPCLSLRVHKDMSDDLFEEAAKAMLSGGGHPILLNDDKLVPALHACGPLSLADARDYTCDGCYEPIIPGKTEWAFSYVPILPYVGMAMNQGATILGAGPVNLDGLKTSWNSPPADQIKTFDQFMDIFNTHWKWGIHKFFNSLMNSYGSLWNYCPSPLFSAFLSDTLESGRDMSNGGARYHIVAPMMCGITNAINALYVIKKLVYDEETARCNLSQLLLALQCNWGNNMTPPFYTTLEGDIRKKADAQFYIELRNYALEVPKFGVNADQELRDFAQQMVGDCVDTIHEAFHTPLPSVAKAYDQIKAKYGSQERPFEFTITPGVGTFEDNVGLGSGTGASADGRLMGQPITDDFSAAPWPDDLPFNNQVSNPFTSLKDWNIEPINNGIANCAPIDLNIPEDFTLKDLTQLIKEFAHGKIGSNMITVTCGDHDTYMGATKFPEKYDLVRVRMGGWSEFFVSMFDFHQDYIMRRPYYRI